MAKIIETNENIYCDFGCGQIALYRQKNGKFICSNRAQKCPEVRKRLSSKGTTRNKGAIRTQTTRDKISKTLTGRKLGPQSEEWKRKRCGKLIGHPFWAPKGKRKETILERKVRELLVKLDIPFEQEKYLNGIGTVDFWIKDAYLVIECDGEYWHDRPEQIISDARRDLNCWENWDVHTLRLRGNRILNEPDWVEMTVKNFTFPYIGR